MSSKKSNLRKQKSNQHLKGLNYLLINNCYDTKFEFVEIETVRNGGGWLKERVENCSVGVVLQAVFQATSGGGGC